MAANTTAAASPTQAGQTTIETRQTTPTAVSPTQADPTTQVVTVTNAITTQATPSVVTRQETITPTLDQTTQTRGNTPTSVSSPTQAASASSSGLSTGALVGIIAGSAVGGLLLLFFVCCLWRRARSDSKEAALRRRNSRNTPEWAPVSTPFKPWRWAEKDDYHPDNLPSGTAPVAAPAPSEAEESIAQPTPYRHRSRRLSNPYSAIDNLIGRSQQLSQGEGNRRVMRRPVA